MKVFAINLVVLAVFVGGGLLLDRAFDFPKPYGLIGGLIISFPVTIKLLKRYVKADPKVIESLSRGAEQE